MSDQMILFNGYPFLEKEDKEDDDHAYFEPSMLLLLLYRIASLTELPVVNVMKRDLVVIHADGMPVPHLEEILQSTDYRGFPVVKSQTDATVLGFILKTELRFSLGEMRFLDYDSIPLANTALLISDRIRRRREDAASLICTFQDLDGDEQLNRGDRSQSVFESSPYIGGPPVSGSNAADKIDLGQYVDQVCPNSLESRCFSNSNLA